MYRWPIQLYSLLSLYVHWRHAYNINTIEKLKVGKIINGWMEWRRALVPLRYEWAKILRLLTASISDRIILQMCHHDQGRARCTSPFRSTLLELCLDLHADAAVAWCLLLSTFGFCLSCRCNVSETIMKTNNTKQPLHQSWVMRKCRYKGWLEVVV